MTVCPPTFHDNIIRSGLSAFFHKDGWYAAALYCLLLDLLGLLLTVYLCYLVSVVHSAVCDWLFVFKIKSKTR